MSKRKNSVGYFSAYYRGLECLLDMWDAIREQVPDATLDVYYGWESWLALEGEDDFYHRMEEKFQHYADKGVTVHGRVNHEELAKAMKEIQVWAYPTQFPEIHCITALKAQEAECYPVVTDVAALKETVQSGTKIRTKRIYIDEYQQEKFVKAVVAALKEGKTGTPVPNTDWSDVAKQWEDAIKELLNVGQTSEATA
ncbi:glycosyltransferase [Caudoviricetes sp.]|nr:glycosyltransferase [Caudoviricetes sp.]